MTSAEQLARSKVEDVVKVYSGKDGACCCGCAGKYYYSSAHRNVGSKSRGYEVTDDEVSDKMVHKVFGMASANLASFDLLSDTQFTFVVGSRLYMVMFD